MVMECKTCNRQFRYIYSDWVRCPFCNKHLTEASIEKETPVILGAEIYKMNKNNNYPHQTVAED